MAPKRTYRLKEAVPTSVELALKEYDPLLQKLLYNRGITEREAAKIFLNPSYDEHLHDPFLLNDMSKAVERIWNAIEGDEHVVIYSDYDCDGIPGAVLLHDLFESIGFSNFENHIPHRHHDGYGFNSDSIKTFAERDTKLIITVDCGIVDHAAVDAARIAGIDVVITDHHEPSDVLPEAYAVVNPKCGTAYPFNGLCGTGVAYKLAQALIQQGKVQGRVTLKDGWEKWWLDMVGLATIADMVPLRDENRVLAHYGLQVLRKSRRPGLQHLLQKSGGSQQHLTEDDIGFVIGPRINAASRMDDPEDAFHMLRTKDEVEAGEHVNHLEKLNNERKGIVATMTKEAKKRLHKMGELPQVIVMGNPGWRPSLVGLVANSLAEEYSRPVFLWGRDGKDIIKGSCRSEGVTSTLRLMEATQKSFIEYGGHHASGGFSVDDEKIHTLYDDLNNVYQKHNAEVKSVLNEHELDSDLSLQDIDRTFLRMLSQLAPFGEGNPKPLFQFKDVIPQTVAVFGKAKNHTKLTFNLKEGRREAIAFFKTPEDFEIVPQPEKSMTLIAHVEETYFRGRMETRLRIVDIV